MPHTFFSLQGRKQGFGRLHPKRVSLSTKRIHLSLMDFFLKNTVIRYNTKINNFWADFGQIFQTFLKTLWNKGFCSGQLMSWCAFHVNVRKKYTGRAVCVEDLMICTHSNSPFSSTLATNTKTTHSSCQALRQPVVCPPKTQCSEHCFSWKCLSKDKRNFPTCAELHCSSLQE